MFCAHRSCVHTTRLNNPTYPLRENTNSQHTLHIHFNLNNTRKFGVQYYGGRDGGVSLTGLKNIRTMLLRDLHFMWLHEGCEDECAETKNKNHQPGNAATMTPYTKNRVIHKMKGRCGPMVYIFVCV